MNLRIPPSSCISRIVLTLGIACLLAVFVSVIFVGAHNADNLQTAASATTDSTEARIAEHFGKLPLSFELNKGQTDSHVKFLSHGRGYDLFLTSTEAVLRVQKPRPPQTDKLKEQTADVREGTVLRLKMLGANTTPQVEGQEELPGKVHYFIGNDPAKWRRNIPTYRRAHFKDIYPGIDVVYYGTQRELEYDYVVGPGANPKLIRFIVEGADQIRLDKKGRLLLSLQHGDVSLNKPVIYQFDENGGRREIKGTYVVNGNEVRFKLERFDSSKPLIIDPVLSYSTLLGSSNTDIAMAIAVDSQGSAYVTGNTEFTGFPTTPGSFKSTPTRGGAFVTKLDPTGSSLVYSTYLNGNTNSSGGLGIAVDSAGNAHVTGNTSALDFPTVNGLKTTSNFFKSTDAAASWNNQNTGLVGNVDALAVAPNAPNTIYASTSDGFYRSSDSGATWTKTPAVGISGSSVSGMGVHPTNSSIVYVGLFSGLYRSTDGGNNWIHVSTPPFGTVTSIVFDPSTPTTVYIAGGNGVAKSTDDGTTWVAQNNFGVPGTPVIHSLAIDPSAPLTIYAGSQSNGVFKSTNGASVWTAMNNGLDGPFPLSIKSIVIDPANPATIYTGGTSGGINKSTNGASSWTLLTTGIPSGSVNAMVANTSGVYAAIGTAGVIRTTNGGTSWTNANVGLWSLNVRALVPHPTDGSVLLAGTASVGTFDAFVTKLNASGSGLLFSTLLGGYGDEAGNGIAVDVGGNILVAGWTVSQNFPVANAAQEASTTKSCSSGFVTKIDPSAPSYVFSTFLRGSQCDTAYSVAVDNSSNVYVSGTTGSNDFLTANAFQPALAGGFNSDAFVTKLTSTGSLTYSTYLGGSNGFETAYGIAADSSGNAYVTGATSSSNFPTVNPIQVGNGGNSGDVFVTKLNSQGSALIYSTYLAGVGIDAGRGIAVDAANNAYVTGFSDSVDFPLTTGALRTRSAIYKSVDGAANWSNDNYGFTGAGQTSFGGTGISSLVVHPTEPSTVYAGTGAGVFKSTNGGRTWSPMNNGLLSRSVSVLLIDPLTPSTLYAMVSDLSFNRGVYKTTDGGATWNRRSNGIPSGELSSLAIDPVTPNTLYVGVSFFNVGGSHIFKTTDGADNWAPVSNTGPLVPSTLAVDPLNHLTIYSGDAATPGNIYKSTDGGTTWQSLGPTVLVARSISVSPQTPGLVYAGTDQTLFKSVDGGTNWSPVPPRTGKIVFDPVSSSTFYLLTNPSSFTPEGIFKSTDNGQTWAPVNKGLNTPQAITLAVDPQRPSNVYVGIMAPAGTDAFVTKINSTGSGLIYSTFLGGPVNPGSFANFNTQAFGIALDSSGNAYVTGNTSASGFPATPGSYQPFNRGSNDAFISKLSTSYNISGQVLNNGATPMGGVEVILNDGTSLSSVFTEGDGSYSFSRLREGGNYTVSASTPHFTMTPASQAFNNLNSDKVQNFTATTSGSPFYTISGTVTENGNPLPGVTITLSGSQSGLRTTDINGNYSFELIGAGNYTVTPSALGFTFGPGQTFNNLSANQTANFAATRQNFVVTNTNNHGTGSLRDAIINANATIGTDTIVFNIPGSGVKTISLLVALPEITDSVVIDGTTQPGYAGTPLIELDGLTLGSSSGNGLLIKTGGSTVRGLSIGNFRTGAGIAVNGCDNNVIQGNYIGIAADGTVRQNGRGMVLTNAANNVIGGTTAANRNVISGNGNEGISISGKNNVVQGNFIGTNVAGTAELHNSGSGITIFDPAFTGNLIGGTAAGAGNLISGNQVYGVVTAGTGTLIQGNLIGTDVTGTAKLQNSSGGISATGQDILVGGLIAGARNVISGNQFDGVSIRGAGNKVQGNYIGTDITGTLALGNGNNGVVAGDGSVVGGTEPGARNIISANIFSNVVLGSNSSGPGSILQGNYIGTDVTGTRAVGASTRGVNVVTNNNLIGGTVAGAGNVISGNSQGVQIGGSFFGIVGNTVQGNIIGLNATGTAPLGNAFQGVLIADAVNNTVGGTQSGAANKIAFNGGVGVAITGSGQGNAVRGNSIFSNAALGIDLGPFGVTPNDGTDPDTGANNLQNFPVITGVISSNNSTTIQGSLKSLPNTTFQIDFYLNTSVDPSGNGEGAEFFNTAPVTTDGNGDATINATFPAGLPAARVITATATDPNGNTSEFSAADTTGAAGSVQFSVGSMQVIEDIGTLPVTVFRTGGTTGSLTVDYATANGTAIAGQDYTSTSGTLTFNSGETSKTIQIPIADDAITETDETFTVSLRNDANVQALGAPNVLVVTLQDHNTTPSININSLLVGEGNAGTTTDALFVISLSAATGRAVSVNYATANQGATGGSKCGTSGIDYETTSGSLSFTPGITSFTIPVKVCGDANPEANEGFRVGLSNVSGATLQTINGFATIIDDDPLELVLEESGPNPNQAAALDALLAVRDPFRVQGIPDFYPNADRNTRVAFYVRNLQLNPGELPSAVSVRFIFNFSFVAQVPAEDVRPIPNTELTQVVIRLPNNLPANTYSVTIAAHTKLSNSGTIRIVP